MKNLHIMHPEDCVFDGKKSVKTILEILKSCMDYDNKFDNHYSIKYDGAPAIVFGTDVNNGRFFVGTKSVFNKGIKKICYTNDCIDYYYSDKPDLNHILKQCLKYLPRVSGIYQGDFIGECNTAGNNLGCKIFTPNTITYKFDTPPTANIILAVHTSYLGDEFDILEAFPNSGLTLPDNDGKVLFLDTHVELVNDTIFERAFNYTYSAIIDTLEIIYEFPTFKTKTAKSRVLKLINSYIRDGKVLNAEELARETNIDFRIFELYILIAQLKEITLNRFKCAENVQSFLSNKEIECEGIVVSHVNHWSRIVIKLVQRYTFSNANFNNPKFAVV